MKQGRRGLVGKKQEEKRKEKKKKKKTPGWERPTRMNEDEFIFS